MFYINILKKNKFFNIKFTIIFKLYNGFSKKKSKEYGGDLLLIIISSSYLFLKNKKKYGEVLLDTFFLNDEIFRKKI